MKDQEVNTKPVPKHIYQGQRMEQIACEFLQQKGFQLVQQNFRCYVGEIDLIMLDQDDMVFVEVRSRGRTDYGTALESITRSKQLKLIRAATCFLQWKKMLYKVSSRFDVVGIQRSTGNLKIDWIKSAFTSHW